MTSLPRVAILGGGVGGVTAAFHLSKPGWKTRFGAITLYQQGWRLGGKGACGRGPGLRIEEHGLHIWFGYYDNAFAMLRRCHEELDQLADVGTPRWPLAFRSVEESFQPCEEIALADHDGCCWKRWRADFFEFSDDRPWLNRDPLPPWDRPDGTAVAFYAARCLHLGADLAWSLIGSEPGVAISPGAVPRPTTLDEASDALWNALGGDLQQLLRASGHAVDSIAASALTGSAVLALLDLSDQALQIAFDFLSSRYDAFVRSDDAVRRACYVVDLMIAIVRGLIEDSVISTASFDVVNGVDFCDWLRSHGARRESTECSLVRTIMYDLPFGYRGGDPQRPAVEAGTALRALLRLFFTYRGALMWKMNSGMGDTVFAPLYELLAKRGVDVRFFHRVEAVRTAGGGVHEIEVDVQAPVSSSATPKQYLRATTSSSGPGAGRALWPNTPEPAIGTSAFNAIGERPEVFESWLADPSRTRSSTVTLTRGAAADGFEHVVFAMPISMVPLVAPDLPSSSKRWKAAVDALQTVPTQALQLWLKEPVAGLSDDDPGVVLGGFVEPFDTWADMQHLVSQEHVNGSKTVAYFCNVMPDSIPPARGTADAWLDHQQQLVRAQAVRFLKRDVASVWPKATNPLTRELLWDVLVDPSGAIGEARLDAQFMRANVEPSERYVLSVPGSSACRIAPDDTDFDNLFIAGDWTACTIDAGCVEAAVMSGMAAANGIHRAIGAPDQQEPILGANGP